jgi:hypothetical protein
VKRSNIFFLSDSKTALAQKKGKSYYLYEYLSFYLFYILKVGLEHAQQERETVMKEISNESKTTKGS